MRTLLALSDRDQKYITAKAVLSNDVAWWLLAVVSTLLLYQGVVWLISSAADGSNPASTPSVGLDGKAILILALGATLVAVRAKGWWLWIPYIVTIVLFAPFRFSFATSVIPSSIVTILLGLMAVLSLARLGEYLNMRYRIGLDEPKLTTGAFIVYLALTGICLFVTNQWLYEMIVCANGACKPM